MNHQTSQPHFGSTGITRVSLPIKTSMAIEISVQNILGATSNAGEL